MTDLPRKPNPGTGHLKPKTSRRHQARLRLSSDKEKCEEFVQRLGEASADINRCKGRSILRGRHLQLRPAGVLTSLSRFHKTVFRLTRGHGSGDTVPNGQGDGAVWSATKD